MLKKARGADASRAQAVHQPPNRQNRFERGICCGRKNGMVKYRSILSFLSKKALSGDFDFPRKRKPTVPMYADGLRLLAFGAF